MTLKLKTVLDFGKNSKKLKIFNKKCLHLLHSYGFNLYVSVFSIVGTEEPK